MGQCRGLVGPVPVEAVQTFNVFFESNHAFLKLMKEFILIKCVLIHAITIKEVLKQCSS